MDKQATFLCVSHLELGGGGRKMTVDFKRSFTKSTMCTSHFLSPPFTWYEYTSTHGVSSGRELFRVRTCVNAETHDGSHTQVSTRELVKFWFWSTLHCSFLFSLIDETIWSNLQPWATRELSEVS